MAGRPRKFSIDTALDQAIGVFFKKGYESASLDDLTEAMNINRPSLYQAFGNKESLYRQALQTYHERNLNHLKVMLKSDPDPIKGVKAALLDTAEYHIQTGQGCLVANSGTEARDDEGYQAIKTMLSDLLQRNEDAFYAHFEGAKAAGYLSEVADPRELAQFFNGVMQGMSVIGRMNNSPEALFSMVTQAMRVFEQ